MRSKRACGLSVIIAAVTGLGMATSARAGDVRWASDAAGNWSVAGNWYGWSDGAHLPDTNAMIPWGTVTLDSPVAVQQVNMGDAYGAPGGANAGALHITTGASLTITTYYFSVGVTSGFNSSVVQDGGTVTMQSGQNNVQVGINGVGAYTMSGGTLNTTANVSGSYNPWWGGINVGSNGTGQGTFKQTGGIVNMDGAYLNIKGSATGSGLYEISGGSFNSDTGGYPAVKFDGAGTFRIKGSKAVIASPNGGGFTDNTPTGTPKGTVEFRLDNSADHITMMTSPGNFARSANLKASLDGGVLLAGTSKFTLIRSNGGYAGWAGDWFSTPTGLWNTSTDWEPLNGGSNVCNTNIALAAGSNKGTLDATGTLGASFAASQYGFVNLANVNTSQPLELLVDVTGGPLSNFTSALDAAGISWATTATPGYNLELVMDPSVSGASNFAWDFGTVDPGMSIDKVSLVAVPEPTTLALLGAMSLVGLGMRKRSATR